MAKAISLNNVNMGVLFIHPVANGELFVQRNYTLEGDDQALFDAAGEFVTERTFLWADVPQNIKTALLAFDTWTQAWAEADRGL